MKITIDTETNIIKLGRKTFDELDKINQTLYQLHYHYMLNYAFYKGKYIKTIDKWNTIYMYVKYQLFDTYISDKGMKCYSYKLTGKGFRKMNKYMHDEDLFTVSNLMQVEISNDKGKFGPRKPEEIEIISKEEFENAYKDFINENLNN